MAAGKPRAISFDKFGPDNTTTGLLGKADCQICEGVRVVSESNPLVAVTIIRSVGKSSCFKSAIVGTTPFIDTAEMIIAAFFTTSPIGISPRCDQKRTSC